jgi:hypothetical protein
MFVVIRVEIEFFQLLAMMRAPKLSAIIAAKM